MNLIYYSIFLSMFCSSLSLASPCSEEDKKYAGVWNNYYDPQEAFDFGETIKKIIDEKDLAGLFEHVDGELTSGPRKNFVAGKNFSEIFSDEWRRGLLESESPCSPVGWRGFMLDNGSVWYNRDKARGEWHIFSILGANKEKVTDIKLPIGWKINERLIPPHCFSTRWMSDDNYQDFAEKFTINDYSHFSRNPGVYFGNEITNFGPIISSWNSEIYLATPLKKCFEGGLRFGGLKNVGFPEIQIDDNSVETKICSSADVCTKFAYSILAEIPIEQCRTLAKNFKGECLKSYLISIGDYSGGTMGWDMSYNIYGLFSLSNGQKYILPLKNFYKKNDAINYIK